MLFREDYRHPCVDLSYKIIRIASDDRAGPQPLHDRRIFADMRLCPFEVDGFDLVVVTGGFRGSASAFSFRDVDWTKSLGTDDSRLRTHSSGDEYDFLHRFLGIHFHHHFLDGAVA